MQTLFSCPVCHRALQRIDQRLACDQSHSFDVARSGYVNLLPAHHRKSKQPGDNAEMVQARRSFLAAGHYVPLADRVIEIVSERGCSDHADLGCGEGYYSHRISEIADQVYGIDISKPAIMSCATHFKHVHAAVANLTYLPLQHHAFDTATLIFAPVTAGVADILKPGGSLLRVSPATDHLREIKDQIFETSEPHRRGQTELPNLTLAHSEILRFNMELDHSARSQLVAMTPMQYRSSRTLAKTSESLTTSAHFQLDVFTAG